MDDLDIHVVNLRTGTSRPHLAEDSASDSDDPKREGGYRRRGAATRRVLISVALVAGILIALVRVYSLLTPVPVNPQPDLASHTILFAHSAPWGRLSIDGHRNATVNDLSVVSLEVGRHTLVYQASPYPDVQCVFHIPAMSSDTCPRYHPVQKDWYFGSQNLIVDFGITLRKMPRSEMGAFVKAAQSALDSATSKAQIKPGEHYVSADGKIVIADRLVAVELGYEVAQIFDVAGDQAFGDEPCPQTCTSFDQQKRDWFVNIPVFPQWDYTLPTGKQAIMSPLARLAKLTPITTPLYVNWTGSWHIAVPRDTNMVPDTIICSLAEGGVSQLVMSSILTSNESMSLSSSVAPSAASGCVVTVTLIKESSKETHAQFLFRFGAIFTANADAHQLFPSLPTASHQEMVFISSFLQTP